jgi:tetratricopeptide (TPR) repeat protein
MCARAPHTHHVLLAQVAGAEAMSKGKYEAAVAIFTAALRALRATEDAADSAGDAADTRLLLLSNRSSAFAGVSEAYRTRPASRSESSALYGLDPTHLAQLALADADKVVGARPLWPLAHARKARALFLLERYPEAEAAYLQGLGVDPEGKELQEGLAKVAAVLGGAKAAVKR